MCGLHVRCIVEAADECVDSNIHRALDISISSQRKIRQPTLLACSHTKLHRRAGSSHRQIEGVFKLDLLGLCECESASDVGKRLLGEHDCSRTHCSDGANKLDVFD